MAITPDNITTARRSNLKLLFSLYVEAQVAAGADLKGLKQTFAESLQISPSRFSQLLSSRPVGNQLARQLEALQGKTLGWLDALHGELASTPAEDAFIELCRRAWLTQDAKGRRALRQMVTLNHLHA